jgi:ribosomal subunit interface protein
MGRITAQTFPENFLDKIQKMINIYMNQKNKGDRMDVIVSARHMDLTEAMRDSVIDALSAIKHGKKLTKAEVVLDSDHKLFRAEIVLHGSGINLDAKAETDNMYEAIDKAVERLQKQLDKKFGQILNSHKGPHLGEIEAEMAEQELAEADDI